MLASIITSPITLPQLLVCLAAAMALGVFNALVFLYRSRHSAGFALTLALLPMAVAMLYGESPIPFLSAMLVNGNIGTGVAVAGAFALVRFRSVPGTAREISAIFSAMALGLALGMGFLAIAAIFFLCTAAFTLVLTRLEFGAPSRSHRRLKITIPENFNYEGLFDDVFQQHARSWELERVKTTNMGTLLELTYQVEMKGPRMPKEFIDQLRVRNGNLNIILGNPSEKEML